VQRGQTVSQPLIRLGSLHLLGRENSRGSLNHSFLELSPSGSVKYLGVILDSRLTWREHVKVKVRKVHNLLWACRRVCGMGWGLGPKVVHWLYVAIVRLTISYASLVWWPRCQMASTKIKLSKVQILACLGITGAFRTTPTGAMEVLVGLPLLDLVIRGR